jgi:hypothetical protein
MEIEPQRGHRVLRFGKAINPHGIYLVAVLRIKKTHALDTSVPDFRGGNFFRGQPYDLSHRITQMNGTGQCGARTRSGASCRAPALPNGRCRIHGGLSPGAPRGAANGRYVHGYWTREAIEERKFIRLLLQATLNVGAKA